MLNAMGKAARAAAYELALLDSARKTQLLEALADALLADAALGEQSTIFQANRLDTDSAAQAADSPDVQRGATLFTASCAQCHGPAAPMQSIGERPTVRAAGPPAGGPVLHFPRRSADGRRQSSKAFPSHAAKS
jgi:mono/diheme cytochrome c family protein